MRGYKGSGNSPPPTANTYKPGAHWGDRLNLYCIPLMFWSTLTIVFNQTSITFPHELGLTKKHTYIIQQQ